MLRLGRDKRVAWRGGDGPCFRKLGSPRKRAGRNPLNSVSGGPRRPMEPEMPVTAREEAGVAAILATTWDREPPGRNSHGGRQESGQPISRETPGGPPGNRMPHSTPLGISRGIPHPWKFPAKCISRETPRYLGCAADRLGNASAGISPGEFGHGSRMPPVSPHSEYLQYLESCGI